MLEYIDQIKDLTDTEKSLFSAEMKDKSKSIVVGQLICFFFGFLGAHRFYILQNQTGIFYFIGIPSLALLSGYFQWIILLELIIIFYTVGLLFEVLLMRGRVTQFNLNLAIDISKKIKSLRN